jgi:hypothetical protein
MTEETISISLELQFAGDTLSGRASRGTGDHKDFTGWIGLVAAIDALAQADGGRAPGTPANHEIA